MAKVKVHNKGMKIVVIDGVQLLTNDTKEIEDMLGARKTSVEDLK